MNTQIYCLPQKFGWNTIRGYPKYGEEEEESYLKLRGHKPFFTTDLSRNDHDPHALAALKFMFPHLPSPSKAQDDEARRQAYMTEYNAEFRPDRLRPMFKVPPPMTFDKRANPLKLEKVYDRPMDDFLAQRKGKMDPGKGQYLYNSNDTGLSYGTWQPLERVPILGLVGERKTLPPVRLRKFDPTYEKERWDNAKNLGIKGALTYGYRQDIPKYTGMKSDAMSINSTVGKDLSHPENKAMESLAHASYREFPNGIYEHGPSEQENKHQGPLSRMVTITHPFNPFTQQSAYCNVGAQDTQ